MIKATEKWKAMQSLPLVEKCLQRHPPTPFLNATLLDNSHKYDMNYNSPTGLFTNLHLAN